MPGFNTGDTACTKTHTHEEPRAGGRRVRVTQRQRGGVITRTRRVLVDRNVVVQYRLGAVAGCRAQRSPGIP